ncbi:hypothetical protein V8V50_11580 [Ligilactobacillus salivarius]
MVVDPDGEIIYVYLPETLYEQYIRYQSVPDIALSIVILPALIQVLSYMVLNRGNDIDEQKWYMVIEKKIRSLDKDINDLFNEKISPLELAQMILENPVERSFNEIKGLLELKIKAKTCDENFLEEIKRNFDTKYIDLYRNFDKKGIQELFNNELVYDIEHEFEYLELFDPKSFSDLFTNNIKILMRR